LRDPAFAETAVLINEFGDVQIDHDLVAEFSDEYVTTTTGCLCCEAKFFKWLQYITQSQGPDILRLKGILDMKGEDQRFVVQGVHMLLEGDRQRPWKPGETRQSRLVFIGRNLDRDLLQSSFKACEA
jgi:G3E family GTPase